MYTFILAFGGAYLIVDGLKKRKQYPDMDIGDRSIIGGVLLFVLLIGIWMGI